jgi:hypothetical protein
MPVDGHCPYEVGDIIAACQVASSRGFGEVSSGFPGRQQRIDESIALMKYISISIYVSNQIALLGYIVACYESLSAHPIQAESLGNTGELIPIYALDITNPVLGASPGTENYDVRNRKKPKKFKKCNGNSFDFRAYCLPVLFFFRPFDNCIHLMVRK